MEDVKIKEDFIRERLQLEGERDIDRENFYEVWLGLCRGYEEDFGYFYFLFYFLLGIFLVFFLRRYFLRKE